jgi:hypothetical protein
LTAINDSTDCSAYKRPMQTPVKEGSMRLGTICIALAILAGSPAIAQAGRFELFPEPATVSQQQGGIGLCHRQEGQPVLDLHGAM